MAESFKSGVFPVHNNKFEVQTGESEWSEIANLEEFQVTINGVVETWQAMENGGWESALKTGASWSINLKGKRTVGDKGNDFIADKTFMIGQNATVPFRWTMPTGTQITQKMVVNVKANGTGGTTQVGALEADLQSDGKPDISTVNTLSVTGQKAIAVNKEVK